MGSSPRALQSIRHLEFLADGATRIGAWHRNDPFPTICGAGVRVSQALVGTQSIAPPDPELCLPGAVDTYDIERLRKALRRYDGLGPVDLRANLKRFLEEIIPTATDLGIQMCIHPDDPPRSILGLPRIVSTEPDIDWILGCMDEPANRLTLCTGSLGSRTENDLPTIARKFGERIHFVHLRNVSKEEDGSFSESSHLQGDVNMIAVIDELL